MDESFLVSRKKGARSLGICLRTLEQLIRRGEIPVVRIGRRILLSPRALEEFANPPATTVQEKVKLAR